MLPDKKLTRLLKDYKTRSEASISKEADRLMTRLVRDAYKSVPAYKQHLQTALKTKKIKPKQLKDIKGLPYTDKKDYLLTHSRGELTRHNFKSQSWMISTTSGSTGEPFYFPRLHYHDRIYAATAEAYLVQNFAIDKQSTLYIVAFPMGAWIGGVFTMSALYQVAEKGYALSIITPGINKLEVIKSVKNLAQEFDQIIIGSYAPFLKDILDDGEAAGIDWKQLNVRFVFSAEAFSEEFRDYLVAKTGLDNIYKDTLNHYGTVDLGTMAHETPYAVLARRLAYEHKEIFSDLFGEISKTPTLAQYDPRLFYFESVDGNLLCSSDTGYPLVRYDLKDHGGVISKKRLEQVFKQHDINLLAEAKKVGIGDTIWNLPFVYVFERSDFSVSYFAFQVYPEVIRKALLEPSIEKTVTGKCSMTVEYEAGRQVLKIYVELRPSYESTQQLAEHIGDVAHKRLLSENSEYRKTTEEIGVDNVRPLIIMKPYEDAEYFKPGGKQKWAKK